MGSFQSSSTKLLLKVSDISTIEEERPHHKVKRLSCLVDNILLGYEPAMPLDLLLSYFEEAMKHAELPVYEFLETLGSISSRIPHFLEEFLYESATVCRDTVSPLNFDAIEHSIKSAIEGLPLDEQDGVEGIILPLRDVLQRYKNGVVPRAQKVLLGILENYHTLEVLYESTTAARVLLDLRETYKNELEKVRDIARSASKPKTRSEFIVLIMDLFGKDSANQQESSKVMTLLSHLASPGSSKVSFRAREILIAYQSPSVEERRNSILAIFQKVVKESPDKRKVYFDFSQLSRTILAPYSMLDILPGLFFHEDINTRAIALYTYVMRTNHAYSVTSFDHHFLDLSVVLSWNFEHQTQSLFNPYKGDNDLAVEGHVDVSVKLRRGIIFTVDALEDLISQVKAVKPLLELPESTQKFSFFATVAIKDGINLSTDEEASKTLDSFVAEHRDFLANHSIRRVTFMILLPNAHSRYFTYKSSRGYAEDAVIRHIERTFNGINGSIHVSSIGNGAPRQL